MPSRLQSRPKFAHAVFLGSHIARQGALIYQRYVFFATLGAAGFGLASMAVAPAIFAVTFVTMITGELVIRLKSEPPNAQRHRDGIKYILLLETAGIAGATLLILAIAPFLPARYDAITGVLLASILIIPASTFSMIASNWALVSGQRTLYACAFYLDCIVIALVTQPLADSLGLYAIVAAYCIRPMTTTTFLAVATGPRKVLRVVGDVYRRGDWRRGRYVQPQPLHQVGSLAIKSSRTTLDVLMVGGLAGEVTAGHYRILRTLASAPGVVVSPIWGWLWPSFARFVREERFRDLWRLVMSYSLLLSLPAVLVLLVPASVLGDLYRWMFPRDDLPAHVLKYSIILWWLVASGAGWARPIVVAMGQLHVSTIGNVLAFAGTFVLGPAVVILFGFDILFVTPATLALLNGYWYWYLATLKGHVRPARPAVAEARAAEADE